MSATMRDVVANTESLPDTKVPSLGYAEMDSTHDEITELLEELKHAQGEAFRQLFKDLHLHTEMHFNREYQRMKESDFPALVEHHAEHMRILNELTHYHMRVEMGRIKMVRAYVTDYLPEWFHTHVQTMDSALVTHLRDTPPR